ncbi:potassium channel family protein [Paenibacillus apiarius]|uniref:TrkA family potassium uptake protein n=1 Tax=Paenibacillus apiarius TaxID=46240 RepID=A0ABT4DYG8_9BACL|nr:TrkA family potassium uptake protein [Paenibacillus apiarius]MBN3525524.1 TrkA family potassium uptake protein [Paenibacillus apiarius]MCY9512627.1 TrkA family potassium uptake protein [Paenibacillus apiarius]MCY9522384.1 TrkA family potassium uptake protein [Paenibacillus apiarius]MCY9553651.1 TrkA family potassium uptake protein [Paenibacillus apiarius]MCY9556595.1 TrkA family potassium uptake protein [Paenibacillus apiarius]
MELQQFAVVGMGRFGSGLAKELVRLGHQVLGIDKDEEVVAEMTGAVTHAVVADATDEDVLRSLGIRNFDCAIVAIGDDIQTSILVSIQMKELGVKKVVAKALSELHGRVLERLDVDRVIYPERDMGIRVAHQLVSPNLLDYIELSKEYTIAELSVPGCMQGMSLKELNPRARFGCSIVALNKPEGIIIAPSAEDVLNERDIMVMIGTNHQIEEFEESIMLKK